MGFSLLRNDSMKGPLVLNHRWYMISCWNTDIKIIKKFAIHPFVQSLLVNPVLIFQLKLAWVHIGSVVGQRTHIRIIQKRRINWRYPWPVWKNTWIFAAIGSIIMTTKVHHTIVLWIPNILIVNAKILPIIVFNMVRLAAAGLACLKKWVTMDKHN